MKTPVLLVAAALLAAVAVLEVASADLKTPSAARAAAPSSTLRPLVAAADRAYADADACRRSLDEPSPPTTRLYRRSPSAAFVAWAGRWWRAGARDCRRTAAELASRWVPTMLCESNKDPSRGGTYWRTLSTGNGYYFAVQFDRQTWDAHRGGLPPVSYYLARGRPPAPATQAVVASRLTYDGWPNCPNP